MSLLTLDRFHVQRPTYETSQLDALAWLADAHARAEATLQPAGFDEPAFRAQLARVMERVACGPTKIATRGHVLGDFLHRRWEEMEIYDVARAPHGAGTRARADVYQRAANAFFESTYATESPPGDLVHVTCTGYVAPSAAQTLVSTRGWGATTRVTHAYHMGCYAAIPAVRIAAGLLSTPRAGASRGEPRVDLVHTELCSLHLDPASHSLEQLVVQSLFADGLVRYSASKAAPHGLELLAIDEQIVPDTVGDMSWVTSDFGMEMTLSREVPARIQAALRRFVSALYDKAGLELARELARSAWAIHPGGPRIVEGVGRALELTDPQTAPSHEVLRRHGNMSSATLPHVWMALLDDAKVAPGTLVASLAFGPGLTLCGALFRKK